MKLDRQRLKDAANAAVGFFVGVGFVSWLLNNPFSQEDFPKYIAYIVGAAIFGYIGWPNWVRGKPDQPA
jgi:hypothetical protein